MLVDIVTVVLVKEGVPVFVILLLKVIMLLFLASIKTQCCQFHLHFPNRSVTDAEPSCSGLFCGELKFILAAVGVSCVLQQTDSKCCC